MYSVDLECVFFVATLFNNDALRFGQRGTNATLCSANTAAAPREEPEFADAALEFFVMEHGCGDNGAVVAFAGVDGQVWLAEGFRGEAPARGGARVLAVVADGVEWGGEGVGVARGRGGGGGGAVGVGERVVAGEDEAAAVEAGSVGGLEPEFLGGGSGGGGGGGEVRGVWRERGVAVCGGGRGVGHGDGILAYWMSVDGGGAVVSIYRLACCAVSEQACHANTRRLRMCLRMCLLCCVTGFRLHALYGAWDLTRGGGITVGGGVFCGGGCFGGGLVDISGERDRAAGGSVFY